MADLQTAFLLSLAVVIAVAAVIVVLFNRLRQPLILGYLIAGMIVGYFVKGITAEITTQNGAPATIVASNIIHLLASLGIILLTFSIGLEFSLKQLRKIGIGVITAAMLEIAIMIVVGYQLGRAIGWSSLESSLLGAMLSVASTMIIARSLRESGGLDNERARLVVGLLVVEDFAAVLILAGVSGLVSSSNFHLMDLLQLALKMGVFIAASLVIGVLLLPRFVDYVGRQRSNELLVLTVLGLCFAMAALSRAVGFSEAIGSFVMGVIISESKYIGDVVRRVEPVKDLFGAIFFITVGMLVDLTLFTNLSFILVAIVITVVFVLAKMLSCTVSTFITGFGARNSIGAGLSMIAIGEFSLMIAAVAISDPNVSQGIYSTIVLVTTMTALIVPYSVKYTDKTTRALENIVPRPLLMLVSYLNLVMRNLRRRSRSSPRTSDEMRTSISRMFLYVLIMLSAVVFAANLSPMAGDYAYLVGGRADVLRLLIIAAALIVFVLALLGLWRRTVKLAEIGTSEAMLATRSAESMGYETTSSALRWTLLGFYIFVGFVIASPLVQSVIQENIWFGLVTVAVVAVAIVILWRSVQTVDQKLTEVFGRKQVSAYGDSSRDLAEIEDIITAMEGGKH